MTDRPSDIPDELLAAHLRRRGNRPAPADLARSVLARVAETSPELRWRIALISWRPRLAFVAAGAAVVFIASLLLVAPPAGPVGTSPTSSPSSSVPSSTTWDPTQRALTPPEFQRVLAAHPAAGTVLIVDDQIRSVATPFALIPEFQGIRLAQPA